MSLDISLAGPEVVLVEKFSANMTHNVTPMWKLAGIYDALYVSRGKKAGEVLVVLKAGLKDMRARPFQYRSLDAKNGWGTYDDALPWLVELVAEFTKYPDATIGVSK